MSSSLVSIGNVVWTRVQSAWMCWPVNSGFLRVLNTTFQNVFLSLITSNSLSQFFSKVKHLFALPAHKLVESVIPLIMLFLAQADYLSASCANFFVAALPYLFIFCCHFSHNSKQSSIVFFKSQHFILTFFSCVQPILSLVFRGLLLLALGSLFAFALVVA